MLYPDQFLRFSRDNRPPNLFRFGISWTGRAARGDLHEPPTQALGFGHHRRCVFGAGRAALPFAASGFPRLQAGPPKRISPDLATVAVASVAVPRRCRTEFYPTWPGCIPAGFIGATRRSGIVSTNLCGKTAYRRSILRLTRVTLAAGPSLPHVEFRISGAAQCLAECQDWQVTTANAPQCRGTYR